ncbi:MAG: hypothetical protein VB050_18245 [Geobacteraceae bacterium]|nr:hypothetical protein [Geobacteraceae bacterium]
MEAIRELLNIKDELYLEIYAGQTLCKLIDTDAMGEHFSGLPSLFGSVFDKIERQCDALDEIVSSLE